MDGRHGVRGGRRGACGSRAQPCRVLNPPRTTFSPLAPQCPPSDDCDAQEDYHTPSPAHIALGDGSSSQQPDSLARSLFPPSRSGSSSGHGSGPFTPSPSDPAADVGLRHPHRPPCGDIVRIRVSVDEAGR